MSDYRNWPLIEIEPHFDCARLLEAAGVAADTAKLAEPQADGKLRLYVQGTKQSRLDAALAAYEPAPALERARALERVKAIRVEIAQNVADTESLLGTTADGTAFALYGLAVLISLLHAHGPAAQKSALGQAGEGKLVALAADFLEKIEAGTIKLPALEKGLEATVADIAARSTGVANVLAAAKGERDDAA